MSSIVPFGKYKGQSVEAMIADGSYCEWLLAQPWFSTTSVPLPAVRKIFAASGYDLVLEDECRL